MNEKVALAKKWCGESGSKYPRSRTFIPPAQKTMRMPITHVTAEQLCEHENLAAGRLPLTTSFSEVSLHIKHAQQMASLRLFWRRLRTTWWERAAAFLVIVLLPHVSATAEREEQGDEVRRWVEAAELAAAGNKDAVPILKNLFETTQNARLKLQATLYLAQMSDTERKYFEFVAEPARIGVQADVPSPFRLDENGNIETGFSEAFLAWCSERDYSTELAKTKVVEWTQALDALVDLGDNRAKQIFLDGITDAHFLVVSKSAIGLAVLRDENAIALITDAARRMPSEIRVSIAAALFYLENGSAHEAAKELILDSEIFEVLRERAIQENAKGAQNRLP